MGREFDERIDIRLVARADVADIAKAVESLRQTDAAFLKTVQSASKEEQALKRVETQARRTADAIQSIPRSSRAFEGLAAPPNASTLTSPEALRAAERAAGLRTERTLAAEDREAQTQRDRRRRFLEDTHRQRVETTDRTLHDQSSDSEGPSLRAKTAVLFGALGSAVALAAKALREYSREQTSAASVDASLASRGVLLDQYREKVIELANVLQKRTGIRRSVFEGAFAQLVENGAPVDQLDQMSKTLENVAGLMRGNVSAAAHAMSEALNGNTSAFTRLGFVIPQNGTLLEKWNAIVEQSRRGAGQLEAQNNTLGGSFTNVRNAANDVLAAVGGSIAKWSGMSYWLDITSKGLEAVAQKMGVTKTESQALNNALEISTAHLNQVRESAQSAAHELNSIPAIVQRATDAFNRQREAAEHLRAAQDEIASSELALRIAQINASEHGGQLTPAQAEVARASTRRQFEVSQFQRNQAADAATIAASERFLSSIGNQRGLAQSEFEAAQAEQNRQMEAHAARGAAGNARAEVQRLRNQFASEQTAAAMAGASDIDSPSEIARRAIQISQMPNQIAAAEARAAEAQRRAESFAPNLNETNLAASSERLARATENLQHWVTEANQNTQRYQDMANEARLSRDTRAARFGLDQRRETVETQDHLNQLAEHNGVIPLNDLARQNQALISAWRMYAQMMMTSHVNLTTEIHQEISALQNDQQQRNQALMAAWAMYSEAVRTGQAELAAAIMRDIRNLQAQNRSQSVLR